jgi:hypothetical protein
MTITAPATARLLKLLQHLPTAQHALAYGSGVFHQPDLYKAGDSSGPMIDFILAVDDPVAWHNQVGGSTTSRPADPEQLALLGGCFWN